ncbi:SAM-dependent methyltransferase [Streptosporangium sandarakinum]|uniref:SAM-dependent methyltransferase n=1 Tax=Streptosporangium sandarakinum TaxID=1260955 RepID=A0A852V1W7_9ACTN|nr:SAM-dependent methyltransferase [Streptosporangium sandarakinum]NYF41658.1 SAM-dependent methyltransferase [Streptosporangium sandarakinum]
MAHPTDGSRPSSARIYAHLLGGADIDGADREAADTLVGAFPSVRDAGRANRGFLLRAVREIAATGVTQFLDLGSGLPVHPNVHDVARALHPDARVVYVDNDPTVVSHRQATADGDGVVTVEGDLRDPEKILEHPRVRATLDFDRPIGLIAVAVLHFVPGDAQAVISSLRDALAPGSHLVVTHACSETMSEEEIKIGETIYQRTSSPVNLRTRAEINALFDGFDLLPPGLVPPADWRPVAPELEPYPERSHEMLAAVGALSR